ncbi:MAG TPA: arginine--tRNA ligase [Thermoanaerobaculia bacterium]|nr:arginine--tRNA ligase [Thermoanaerobaculia bacterium]
MNLESIIEILGETLRGRVLALWGVDVERIVLQVPPRLSMGDLATPVALELARRLKRPPREIATRLADGIDLPPVIAGVTVEGAGYLNFRFDRGLFMATHIRNVMSPPAGDRERVIVEHTNINPNKAAHIGHLRNAVLGDTLVRCLRWLGNRVETQNYIDDTGVQVADVVVGFERFLGEDVDAVRKRIANEGERFDYFCWDLYARTVRSYQENPEAKEWQRETLHRIERQEGATSELASVVAEAVVRWHLRTALRIDIEYDLLIKESDIIRQRFWDRAFELLKESGAVVYEAEGKHAGCWVMKLADSPEFEGMEEPDKILVRSNGTVTYVGKDIAYQLWKFGLLDRSFAFREFLRYPDDRVLWESTSENDSDPDAPSFGDAERVFNVIDIRQGYLQKIVREGVRQLGHAEAADHSIHFSYEMVALSPATANALGMTLSSEDSEKSFVEMSGRKGLGVKADDLLDTLEAKALEAVRESMAEREGAEAPSETDLRELARRIAVGSLRYFMLKYGRNKVIAFDFREALTFEGDSGPYLQYSTVRAENIFRKMRDRGVDARLSDAEVDELAIAVISDDIWEIVRGSAETSAIVRRAVESLELSVLTHHALELSQKFNSFYHKYPVLNEKDDAERQRRAACAEIFRQTMIGILALLGIPLPDRM